MSRSNKKANNQRYKENEINKKRRSKKKNKYVRMLLRTNIN